MKRYRHRADCSGRERAPNRFIVVLKRADGTDRNSPRDMPGYDGRGASKALLLAIARVRNKGGERALVLNELAIDEDGLVEREQAREGMVVA